MLSALAAQGPDPLVDLPFNTQQFLDLFVSYNAAIWPVQIIAYGLGFVALAALRLRHPKREQTILAVLASLWAWNAIAYQLAFFTRINPAAFGFAALFALQALVLAICTIRTPDLRFEIEGNWRSFAAMALIAYAMLLYEALALWAGHGLMQGPIFGVAPCPTTIFTAGILLLGHGSMLKWLSIIPVLWAVVGTSAAVLLGITEDLGLGVAGVILATSLGVRLMNEGRNET